MIDQLKKTLKNTVRVNLKGYILIIFTFISGAILSMVLNFAYENEVEMDLYLKDFVLNVKNYSTDPMETFGNAMVGYIKFITLMFLFSLCAVGYIGTLGYIFIKGFSYGAVIGSLFNLSFLKGTAFLFCAIIPHSIIVVPCCVAYSFLCVKNSLTITKGIKDIKNTITKPFLTGVLILLLTSTGALIQAYLEPVFIRLINFH